jgi:MFS family permease
VAAVAQLVFVVVVATLRFQGAVPIEGVTYSVRDGLRYLRTDPVVALLIAGVAAVGIGADPAITLAPSLSESLGGGPQLVGLIASAFGAGAFVGFFLQALLLRFVDHPRLAPLGLLLLAGGTAAVPFATGVAAAVTAFGVAGAGMTLALTGFTTLLYERVPRQYVGRIMALWMVGFVGSRPLAAALGGSLADLFSVDVALAATAAIVLAVAFVSRPAVLRRPVPDR